MSYYNCNKTIILKDNDSESSFDEEYKDVLKNQFWNYKFTLESWFKWKKEINYKLNKL